MTEDNERFDVIVVGVGGMGSAALHHLASRGKRVLGLEQFDIAHDQGSSHGLSRIIRLAYFEDPSYVPLLKRSYELWKDLEQKTKMDLLLITGSLDIAYPGSESVDQAQLSADMHGIEYERLTPEEVNVRFPGYSLPSDYKALFQPEGGILAPEKCITAHCQAAVEAGAVLQEKEKVLSWRVDDSSFESGDGGVIVTTDKGEYSAKKLVLTAGAWLPQLVPELQSLCTVERQVIGWFDTGASSPDFESTAFPVCILDCPDGLYYAFPTFGIPGFKIGLFNHLHETGIDPDTYDRSVRPDDEAALRKAVTKFFPGADNEMTKAAACMFTNTPDKHFVIDLHPSYSQVVLCSACSGHGFKFCSVVGEILADLAEFGTSKNDIDFLRINAVKRSGHGALVGSFRAADSQKESVS